MQSDMSDEVIATVSYILFVYKEELRRRKTRVIRFLKQKLHLTEMLVATNSSEINTYSEDELGNYAREVLYKEKLQQKMKNIERLRKKRHRKKLTNAECRGDNANLTI